MPVAANAALINAAITRSTRALLRHPQRRCVLSRDQLLGLSRLHDNEVYDRSIDTQVARLRKKIEPGREESQIIHTERGAGYIFTAAVEVVR